MDLEKITPLVLTYNEEANIGRTLGQLTWAKDVVVVDSYSNDDSIKIAKSFDNVRVYKRKFDKHANQWNYGLQETDISTKWVLALDADYFVPKELVKEVDDLEKNSKVSGFEVGFDFCVNGKPLHGTIYPPKVVLFKKNKANFYQDGHTQRISVSGEVAKLSSKIKHDDRKSLERYFKNQLKYTKLESKKIKREYGRSSKFLLDLKNNKLISPFLLFLYILFVKGCILDGWHGVYYGFRRMITKAMLSIRRIESENF